MKEKKAELPLQRVYQGTERERKSLRGKILAFAAVCLLSSAGALTAGFFGPMARFHYTYGAFAVGEVVMAILLAAESVLLAVRGDRIQEVTYRRTIAAIPGVCLGLVFCNALAVIASLVQLGRQEASSAELLFLLISLAARLICMECAHLCRKTVTHSIWVMKRVDRED